MQEVAWKVLCDVTSAARLYFLHDQWQLEVEAEEGRQRLYVAHYIWPAV